MVHSELTNEIQVFQAWVEMMPERIDSWLSELPEEKRSFFDYSIESLDRVEDYLISRFTLEDLKDQSRKFEFDAVVCYTLKVFEKHWTRSEFRIELEDKSNILYKVPAIRKIPAEGADFSPYMMFPPIINTQRREVLKRNLVSRIK